MMRWLVTGCVITAVLLLGAAYGLGNYWVGLLPVILIGIIWLAGVWLGRSWPTTVGLVGLVLITAVAALLGLAPILLLTGMALALFAWNLGNVNRMLTAVPDIRDESALIKTHLQWSGGTIGLGWLLGLIALNIQFSINFWWALVLGIVVVFALSHLVRRLQQEPVD
jgi:hypothetical protein